MAEPHAEPNALGGFLRARRGLARAERPDVVSVGRRRTLGLRREEVALLARVSADYYKRLEQGQDRHPSDSVLAALGRALELDHDEIAYLRRLAGRTPAAWRPAEGTDEPAPSLLRLLDSWADTAAFVVDAALEVVACTALGRAVHPGLARDPSMVRLLFLDAEERGLYEDWERAGRDCVAWLRSGAGTGPDQGRILALVADLTSRSDDFARLWARHEVSTRSTGAKRLAHPVVGELLLEFETFTVNGPLGQSLIVYHAEPGSASAASLTRLARNLDRAPWPSKPPPPVGSLEDARVDALTSR